MGFGFMVLLLASMLVPHPISRCLSVIRLQVFLSYITSVVELFSPERSDCMLCWAYFGVLVFWSTCDIVRLQAQLFAWFHSYFCLDAPVKVRKIPVLCA